MLRFLRFISSWFAPTTDAIFSRHLPWTYRWRLLGLQPIALLTYAIKYIPWMFSRRYSVIEIPTRDKHKLRAIVFQPRKNDPAQRAPVHIHFHGGAFLGGLAEYDAAWCEQVSDQTGAVVISAQYRYAPRHVYPCAHEDAEDVISWILKNASQKWNGDPSCLTVSGDSAGANLMFVAGPRARAALGFCAPVDFRLPPWEKPKPPGMPSSDPLRFLMPLFDSYASPVRQSTMNDARLNPILKPLRDLPANVLFIVAGIDILALEQLTMIEQLKHQRDMHAGSERRFKGILFEKGFHGWLALPFKQFDEDRRRAYSAGVEIIMSAQRMEHNAID